MKAQIIISLLFSFIILSCHSGVEYKYTEIIEEKDFFNNWEEKEKNEYYFRAQNDSAAYLEAFAKWQDRREANRMAERRMKEIVGYESSSRPIAFRLYNKHDVDISSTVTFDDKDKLEKEIIERAASISQRLNERLETIQDISVTEIEWEEMYVHNPINIRKGKSTDTEIVDRLNRNGFVFVISDSLNSEWTPVYSKENLASYRGYIHVNLLNSNPLPNLQVTEVNLNSRGTHGYEVSGSVRNNSNQRYSFVTVRIRWMNESSEVVDTGSTYAVGSEGILPGESSTYSAYTGRTDVHIVSVSILDYR